MGPRGRRAARGQAARRQRDRRRRRGRRQHPRRHDREGPRGARPDRHRRRRRRVPAHLGPQRHARARLRGARAHALARAVRARARRSRSPTRSAAATSSTRSAGARRCGSRASCRRARCCSSTSRRRRSSTTRSRATASCWPCAAPGFEPHQVVLEITERTDARKEILIPEAARLRALGFLIALDDVGAGNAGLEMLRALPVDFIKIDRAVVASAGDGPQRARRAARDHGLRARERLVRHRRGDRDRGDAGAGARPEPERGVARARCPGRPGLPARPARAGADRGAELLEHARDALGPDRGPRAPAHRGGAAGRRRALPRAPAHRPRHGRRAVRPRHALPGHRRRHRPDRPVARDPRGQDRARGARRDGRRRARWTRCCAPRSTARAPSSSGSAAAAARCSPCRPSRCATTAPA